MSAFSNLFPSIHLSSHTVPTYFYMCLHYYRYHRSIIDLYPLSFSIKDLSIPYHFNSYLCLSQHQDHSTWCSQRIRHLSAEYAGHTPILRYNVTYLQINQLVEFPADSAPSIRIGRPSHTLARMYQLSYSFRYFRPCSPPPFQPQVH
jgi:hypothetical protein